MHFKNQIALILSAASLAATQNLANFPDCAQQGALNAITATGCNTQDLACICGSQSFATSFSQYAKDHCSNSDYNSAMDMGKALCTQAGVSGISVAAGSTTATTTAAATSTTTASTSSTKTSSSSMNSAATNRLLASDIVVSTKCSCEEVTYTRTPISTPTQSIPIATWTGAAIRHGAVEAQDVLAGVVGAMALIFSF